jgi:hypothetical protein
LLNIILFLKDILTKKHGIESKDKEMWSIHMLPRAIGWRNACFISILGICVSTVASFRGRSSGKFSDTFQT